MTPITIVHLDLLIEHQNKTTKFHLLSATKQKIASTLVARKFLESPDDDLLQITDKGRQMIKAVEEFINDFEGYT